MFYAFGMESDALRGFIARHPRLFVLTGSEESAKVETRAMTAWVRDDILKLLHPFIPFVSEELWSVTARVWWAALIYCASA